MMAGKVGRSLDDDDDDFDRCCARCFAPNCEQLCGRCREILYCSRECQREDWRNHKKVCNLNDRPEVVTVSKEEEEEEHAIFTRLTQQSFPSRRVETAQRFRIFDAVVSLGPNCLTAYRITKAGLKRRSFPFDIMTMGSDGFAGGSVDGLPRHEDALCTCESPVGLHLVVECLLRDPPFHEYVACVEPVSDINAVCNYSFAGDSSENYTPFVSAHFHDDPSDTLTAQSYQRRASRFLQLLESNYRVLFVYTLRLRDLADERHILSIARSLVEEVERLCSGLGEAWPSLDYRLLIPVLGELQCGASLHARIMVENAVLQLATLGGGNVIVEKLHDAPLADDQTDGCWGDEDAWAWLFEKYRVKPRNFCEAQFAESARRGESERAQSLLPPADGRTTAKFRPFAATPQT